MSDEQAFLAAIQANSTDQAVKLIFADWLQDQGRDEHAVVWRIAALLVASIQRTAGDGAAMRVGFPF
jgi:uncharacterized protein (TIGR02996 family)